MLKKRRDLFGRGDTTPGRDRDRGRYIRDIRETNTALGARRGYFNDGDYDRDMRERGVQTRDTRDTPGVTAGYGGRGGSRRRDFEENTGRGRGRGRGRDRDSGRERGDRGDRGSRDDDDDGDDLLGDGDDRGLGARGAATAAGTLDPDGDGDRDHFFSVKSLTDIGASDVAVSALQTLGVVRPSKIQAISYSGVLTGKHCVVADQTGTGKTLAYLAPLVQRLRLDEQAKVQGRARPGRPRVLILAPTAELAQQVHGVAQMLSGTVPFRSCCFTGGIGRKLKTQADLLQEGVDLLVATPGRVATLLEAEALSLEDCRAIVLDEVDVLFMDETFKLAPIGSRAPEDTQFIFVTATLPQSVSDMLKAEFPGTKFLLGPGLHRVAPGVEEVLIDCSGPPGEPRNEETGMRRKREALLSQLERRKALRTLVFCNTIQGCRQVENILSRASRKGQFETLVYHSAIDPKKAADNMRQFMRSNALTPMVMVCTDRSSRGMDFDRAEARRVEHVLLYDFPRDPIEYMRRVGRTARAGRKGIVTVLAWGRQVPLVREILSGNKRGKRLLSLEN
ncbi:unnamed protein product [Ascophyllum nodosum]